MPKTKWGSVIFTAYKFFDSKELLFFAVLEDIHTEGFAAAQHSLRGNAALPPAERAAAILTACRWLSETRALVFIENDAESLLRRLPQDILSTHCHDDEGHIRALPEESGLCPRGGTALAAVRGLTLRSASCIRRSSPCWSTGPAGSCFNRGRLQRCGFSTGYRFAHSNQVFYPMVKFPYLPSHRKEGTFMECDSSVFSLSDAS